MGEKPPGFMANYFPAETLDAIKDLIVAIKAGVRFRRRLLAAVFAL